MQAPGMGESRQRLLGTLKQRGPSTIPELAAEAGLNVETVRHHVRGLVGQELVAREGTRRSGPGRPEVVYVLTKRAESLFPRREGELLRELVMHLKRSGHEALLEEFFEMYIGARRGEALARVAGLKGRARVEEAGRILSELGFMAEVDPGETGAQLRLCHCPLREVVDVTTIPCRAELGFIRELVGERLARLSYIPSGDASCTYRARSA
ncbi:MAG TPA: helix-turn-helix domain-containing protein [Longimicrobiales bacterium]